MYDNSSATLDGAVGKHVQVFGAGKCSDGNVWLYYSRPAGVDSFPSHDKCHLQSV